MGGKRIDLKKNVFSKAQYTKTININFKELGVTTINEDLQSQPSVEQFFQLYNDLFYDIPPNGPVNSHEYLAQTSGEYINYNSENIEIEALRAEISIIRRDLLNAQMENVKLQISGSASSENMKRLSELQNELNEANSTLASSSEGLSQTIGDLTPELAEVDTSNQTGIGYFD
jgi:hypothetical protein